MSKSEQSKTRSSASNLTLIGNAQATPDTPVLTPSQGKKPRARARQPSASSTVPRPLHPPRIFRYVDAVARFGSIRKAAEALHVVSSALNRRILDLEEELGSPLFERLPRGVRPTAAGDLYLAYVRRCMRELERVSEQVEGLRGLLRGRVRIAVAESVTGHMLPTAVARFQSEHPNVCFHVWVDGPSKLADALLTDTADLILTHEPYDHPELSVIAAVTQPFCALVSPDHPLAERTSLRLRDCADYPIALPDETLASRKMIDRALLHASFQFEPALVSNSVELTKTFARANRAVCFQFRIGGTSDSSGLLEIPLTDPGFASARLNLAVRRGRVLPVAAAAFAQQLEEQFERMLQGEDASPRA
jgi:DNA-binding transcriptional LysR family regulator